MRNAGAAAWIGVRAIRCTTICSNLGLRGGRGDRFLTYPNRAGSLETCGFKQRFWSLLGLRPKVTRARGRVTSSTLWLRRPRPRTPQGPAVSAAPFLSAAKEMGERTPPKPNGFWISFARFKCGGKRFHRESATSLPPLPLTRWAVGLDGPTGLGDYQIAHLPPAAASVGAARWDAGI